MHIIFNQLQKIYTFPNDVWELDQMDSRGSSKSPHNEQSSSQTTLSEESNVLCN
jgi:hypothetical protein